MKKIFYILLFALAILQQGCAAILTRYDYNTSQRQQTETAYFSGTVLNTKEISNDITTPIKEISELSLAIVDLPFSFITDILFIPSDIVYQWNHEDNELPSADTTTLDYNKKASIHITLNNTGSKDLADASVQFGKHFVSSGLLSAGAQATHLYFGYPLTAKPKIKLIFKDSTLFEREIIFPENNILKKADTISIFFRINTDTDNITIDVYEGLRVK